MIFTDINLVDGQSTHFYLKKSVSSLFPGLKKLGARSYRAPNVHLSIQYGARIFVHL